MKKTRYIFNIILVCFVLFSISAETAYKMDMIAIEECNEIDSEKETIELDSLEKDKKNMENMLPYLSAILQFKNMHAFYYENLSDLNYHNEFLDPPELPA